ncbi:hypothetical protein BDZ91DRAFT_844958 [Kalaharituber pfeilii]|nr:hypothetical protein BDZ91DRAFT_844958 [Kalaharituber pfeilii]
MKKKQSRRWSFDRDDVDNFGSKTPGTPRKRQQTRTILAIYYSTPQAILHLRDLGTGKAVTVREVIAQLLAVVAAEEIDDFIFVKINGMDGDCRLQLIMASTARESLRVTPTHALALLEDKSPAPGLTRAPWVLLIDDLDQLVTKNQSVTDQGSDSDLGPPAGTGGVLIGMSTRRRLSPAEPAP